MGRKKSPPPEANPATGSSETCQFRRYGYPCCVLTLTETVAQFQEQFLPGCEASRSISQTTRSSSSTSGPVSARFSASTTAR